MPIKTYLDLLEDSDVKHWYENLRRGSKVHGDLSLKRLKAFCKWSGLSPKEIVSRAKESIKDFQHLVEDYVSYLEREGKSPAYIGNLLKPIRSWLEYNHAPRLASIKITNSGVNITTLEERVPTKEELARIFRFLKPRERVAAALLAFAGLRIEVLGNYDGTDGLVLGDLPELVIGEKTIAYKKVPTMIIVRPTLSKAGHRYFTFLSSEGCDYFKEYLESRMSNGERFTEKSPVISPYRSTEKSFLYATKVGDLIRTGIRAAGFKWRPYVLRAYCDTAFDIAEAKGLISHPWRQFFMGHKGDIEARYSTNKGRLPPDMVEEMREAYRRCEPYLQTMQTAEVEDPQITTLRTMVESGVLDLSKPNVRQYLIQKLGIRDMEVRVAKMKESGLDEKSAHTKIICEELGIEPMKIEAFKPTENSDPKKIVAEDELEHYLVEGWNVQTVLPSGKILIRKE